MIIYNNFEFFKLRNRVNVACFKIINNMYVIENVIIIIKLKINQQHHFENVFIHIIDRKICCTFNQMKKHNYVFIILKQSFDFVNEWKKFSQSITQIFDSVDEWKKFSHSITQIFDFVNEWKKFSQLMTQIFYVFDFDVNKCDEFA